MVKYKKKAKEFIKTMGKGTKRLGGIVAQKTQAAVKKYQESRTPEAQQRRLEQEEKRMATQAKIARHRQAIAKSRLQGGGGFGGGFDIGGNLGSAMGAISGTPRKRKGKPFDPFSQF